MLFNAQSSVVEVVWMQLSQKLPLNFSNTKNPSVAEPQSIGKNDDEEPRKAGIRDTVTVGERQIPLNFFSDP